jgi:hypothetical protein
MIDIYTNDLVSKLKTVTALGENVAASMGGTEADPALALIAVPAAWVVFSGMQNTGPDHQRFQLMRLNYSVVLILGYGAGEVDFVDTQLKLIDDASQAVRGTIVNDEGSKVWGYDGCTLISVNPDRVVYQLNFSADAAYAKQLT